MEIKPKERTVYLESEVVNMTYYETKIGKIIEEEFDSRMGNAVISYIMDEGIENVKEITEKYDGRFKFHCSDNACRVDTYFNVHK